MRNEYDFSKGRRNSYAARLKRQVTIRLDEQTIAYSREGSQESGIPYQTLINLYLRDCAASRKRLSLAWKSVAMTPFFRKRNHFEHEREIRALHWLSPSYEGFRLRCKPG